MVKRLYSKLRNLKLNKKLTLIIAISAIVIIVLAFIPSYYFYNQYQNLKKNSQEAALEEARMLTAKISRLIELPSNEDPVLATVSDKNKLKDQDFFTKSENGDKVLIYEKARKAYLYRPSADKLIEVTALSMNINNGMEQVAGKEDQQTKIILRNGTAFSGLTNTYEKDVTLSVKDSVILRRENAVSNRYSVSTVIPVNEKARPAAQDLAESLGMKVADFPRGESRPEDADIVVIFGYDKVPVALPTYTPAPTLPL